MKNTSNSSSRDNSRPATPTSTTSYFISHKGQLISQAAKMQPQIKDPSSDFSPTKFSIMKHPQQSDNEIVTPDLTNTSILDLPIIFADNDGNIEEEVVTTEPSSIRLKTINNTGLIKKSIVINRQGAKMVLINKGAVMAKPLGSVNVIGRPGSLQKILMTNAKQTTKIITIPSTTSTVTSSSSNSGKKVEIINNMLIKPASSTAGEEFT